MELHVAIHCRMVAMRPMERWIDIVAIYQGPEGVSSSGDSRVFRGSRNIPRSGIQLVGRSGTEEEVDNNIPCQEEERSIY